MGKAHYMGKDLTEVRSPQRQLVPDIVGLEKHEPTFLRAIANKATTHMRHRFRDLYRYLNADLLHHCWRELNKHAAGGVDGMTASEYAKELDMRIEALAERLKTKRYRAKLVRRVYIPKENGKERPLVIPALEDKLVQLAVSKLLSAIYEADFLNSSYGYRPGRGAADAIRDLTFDLQYGKYGYVIEADIKGFFDHVNHDWLLRMLKERIDDGALLGLIRKWLKAGVVERGRSVVHPQSGTPQGGIISPVLANIYLHYALDLWFERVVKTQGQGEALISRYADDFVCAFRYREDAERFYRALPKRLEKFSLQVAAEKTRLVRVSRFHPSRKRRITFLGFELYWAFDRQGEARVKRRTAPKKLQGACRRIKQWIRDSRHLPGREFSRGLNRRLRGHYNYFGIRGNSAALYRFYEWAISCTFKWLNRRGGKRSSFTWTQFSELLERIHIERPRITEVPRRRVFA